MALQAYQPQANALWSNDKQMTTSSSLDYSPVMTQDTNGRIWMFWHSKPAMATSDIFYNYTDDGITWSRGTRFTTDLGNDGNPIAVSTHEGEIWVFWVSDRDGNYELYYKISQNNGIAWSPETRFTFSNSTERRPYVMQAQNGAIWIAWYGNRSGNDDLWYKVYNGETWGQDVQLTTDLNRDIEPSIIQDTNGKIWVFWSAYRTGDFELYYKTSSDYGASWSGETQLTDDKNSWDQFPSAIQTRDGTIWVVWMTDKNGMDFDIYYKTYNGYSWSNDEAFIARNTEEKQPTIFQSMDGTVWVAWVSDTFYNYDVFYRTTLNQHDVAVVNIRASRTTAYRGNVVSIEVVATNHGNNPENFEVKCYADSTLIGSRTISLAAEQVYSTVFTWNTTNIPFDTYLLTATATVVPYETNIADNTRTGGTVQVRVPGDINGDGIVDVYDAVLLILDIDAIPNSPKWNNGRSDLNDDGRVSGADVTILVRNFGRVASP